MTRPEKTYLCIDLKSFYASVECVDRGLDPLKARLVVADTARGPKTICLAVSPALKALGLPGRCRLFEIPDGIDFTPAKPRMQRYMDVSSQIYAIYLRHVSPQDIHIYSIDECFIDATPYLTLNRTDAVSFARLLMAEVLEETGIRATVGIGTNLFLAKVALDVTAKHSPNFIGQLDEGSFYEKIWFHTPITDIWGIGPGIARRLAKYGVRDLAGVAALNPAVLHREFGVNAEHLIDHAWGQEPCTMADIKDYRPEQRSMVNGQVLPCDYSFEEARVVLHEMIDASILELVQNRLVTDHISLYIGYAREGTAVQQAGTDPEADPLGAFAEAGGEAMHTGCRTARVYDPSGAMLRTDGRAPHADSEATRTVHRTAQALGGEASPSVRGRPHGLHTGGSRKIGRRTNSRRVLMERFDELFEATTRRDLSIRRINVGFGDLMPERYATATLFDDTAAEEKEHDLQRSIVAVRERFGKNALLKAASLHEKATARERNTQIGGHNAQ